MATKFCEDGGVSKNKERENLEATEAEIEAEAEKPIRTEDCQIKTTKIDVMGRGQQNLCSQWNPQTKEMRLAFTPERMNKGVFISLQSVDKEMADASQFPYGPGEILSIAPDTYNILAGRTERARKKEDSKVEAAKRKLGDLKSRIISNKDKK